MVDEKLDRLHNRVRPRAYLPAYSVLGQQRHDPGAGLDDSYDDAPISVLHVPEHVPRPNWSSVSGYGTHGTTSYFQVVDRMPSTMFVPTARNRPRESYIVLTVSSAQRKGGVFATAFVRRCA